MFFSLLFSFFFLIFLSAVLYKRVEEFGKGV